MAHFHRRWKRNERGKVKFIRQIPHNTCVNLRKNTHTYYTKQFYHLLFRFPCFGRRSCCRGRRCDATERVSSSAQSRTSGRCTERPRGLDTWATAVEKKHKELRLNYTSVSGWRQLTLPLKTLQSHNAHLQKILTMHCCDTDHEGCDWLTSLAHHFR